MIEENRYRKTTSITINSEVSIVDIRLFKNKLKKIRVNNSVIVISFNQNNIFIIITIYKYIYIY
jgi:hypothetical protein